MSGGTGQEPRLSYPVAVHYETVAAAYRDLEQVSSRLALIGRLAELLRETPDELLPRVVYLCLGEIAPAFTGIEIGLADKMVTRALADGTGVPLEEVRATCARPATSA